MCGIAGFIHYRDPNKAADTAWLDPVLERLRHRGPDGDGTWSEGPVAFGHRRLSIIDLAGGTQPMTAANAPLTITFNGEIYNHVALHEELARRGATFATRSDTEVILQAYRDDPEGFIPSLNGMFAFGLWDAIKSSLLLARDRFGVKPLYWTDTGDTFFFASELRALLAFPGVARELDPAAVHEYLMWEYVAAPRSLLKGIFKLAPGEQLEVKLGEGRQKPRYHRPVLGPKFTGTAAEAEEGLTHHLRAAVDRHLTSDVPVGAFLSGGVDSSGLLACMSELQGPDRQAFTLGFGSASWDERAHARQMAEYCGAHLFEDTLGSDGVDGLEDVVAAMDEPMADVSALPTLMVSRLAASRLKVVLSGDGADELFAGYERHSAQAIAARTLDHLPGGLRRGLAGWAGQWPQTPAKKGTWNQLRRLIMGGRYPTQWKQMRWQVFRTPHHEALLYTPAFAQAVQRDQADWIEAAEEAYAIHEPFDEEVRLEIAGYLPNDILTKVDTMSMACSLEARVPYLDHELADFALRLPATLKIGTLGRKRLLKRVLRGRVPDELLDRPKQGFSMPLRRWMGHEWYEPVAAALAQLPDGLNPEGALQLLEEHRSGKMDHQHVLWSLFLLARWWDECNR